MISLDLNIILSKKFDTDSTICDTSTDKSLSNLLIDNKILIWTDLSLTGVLDKMNELNEL
jgi:hypothetical protein